MGYWSSQAAGNINMKIDDFKEFVDKTVTMRMETCYGETATVRVILVSEEYDRSSSSYFGKPTRP